MHFMMDFFYSFRFFLSSSHVRCSSHRYRFVELHYRRKGRNDPAKTQTVVIFLPDVRSCVPTRIEWDDLNAKYKQHFETSIKKGNDDVVSNSVGDTGDPSSSGNVGASSINESRSTAVGLSENDNESDRTKTTASDEACGEPADGEAATANNEKALQINCYFFFFFLFILNSHFCPQNISNLETYTFYKLHISINRKLFLRTRISGNCRSICRISFYLCMHFTRNNF